VDPALAAGEDAHGVADLDQLRLGEVAAQVGPQRVVGPGGVPGDRVGVAQGDALALGEQGRGLVVGELAELVLGDGLLS
jgi:hypothetical protein